MLDLSIEEYIALIEKLTVSDLIIYYFAVYFFIILIERILAVKIETDNKINLNPKVLISLILIQNFQFLHKHISNFCNQCSVAETLLLTAFVFIMILFFVERLLLSERSIFSYLYSSIVNNAVGLLWAENELALHKEVKDFEKRNGLLNRQKGIDVSILNIQVMQFASDNKKIKDKAAINHVIKKAVCDNKTRLTILMIDVYIAGCLIIFSSNLDWKFGLMFFVYAIYFLHDKITWFLASNANLSKKVNSGFLIKKPLI